jgi:hypothetical protein
MRNSVMGEQMDTARKSHFPGTNDTSQSADAIMYRKHKWQLLYSDHPFTYINSIYYSSTTFTAKIVFRIRQTGFISTTEMREKRP